MYDISKRDYHRETIEKALGCAPMVYYSANGELDEVAVLGKVILQSVPHLDGHESYTSAMIETPTWLDVALCADAMIRVTGDEHHIFLENVFATGEIIHGVGVYNLVMGS